MMTTARRMNSARGSVVAILAAFATGPFVKADPALQTTLVASGLSSPLSLTHAPGDYSRIFVCEKGGKIKIIQNNTVRTTPFLDIGSLTDATYLEYGLLGLCFHPNYQQNGFFYVAYTVGNSTLSDPVIARFHVSADPNVADFSSRVQILRIPYTIKQHRAGWIAFGPDGYLYVATGDGGEGDPSNAGSDLTVMKGKILRLDVNGPDGIPGTADDDGFPADANKNYRIPANNPFVSTPGAAGEIWCYGLRNPWQCSFDRNTGELWIGDVGQGAREEVDYARPFVGGYFYGWRCKEGTQATGYSGCPAMLPTSEPPVHEYAHTVGTSVFGGYVYRGCAIPGLEGTYFFGDWNGKLFSFRYAGSVITTPTDRTAELNIGGGTPVAYGEDGFGELYIVQYGAGTIRKIVPATFIGPDCNSNGRNDKCDITAGAVDANHDNIPDECQAVCPTISQDPASQALIAGQNAAFNVVAAGTGPFSYQWRRNGANLSDGAAAFGMIAGATGASLSIGGAMYGAAGNYDVVVTNSCGGATSMLAALRVMLRGDANCDGAVTNFDIDPFVAAIIDDPVAYAATGATADCYAAKNLWGDINATGGFDNFDIDPFIACLLELPAPANSCP